VIPAQTQTGRDSRRDSRRALNHQRENVPPNPPEPLAEALHDVADDPRRIIPRSTFPRRRRRGRAEGVGTDSVTESTRENAQTPRDSRAMFTSAPTRFPAESGPGDPIRGLESPATAR